MTATRTRLPNRREFHIETLEVAGQEFTACIGFDPETGQPREVFLDPVECSAFNETRPVAGALLEDIKLVFQSYIDTLQNLAESGYAGNAYDQVMEEQMEAGALMKLYVVKYQQAKIQTERTRKTESEIVKQLQGGTARHDRLRRAGCR